VVFGVRACTLNVMGDPQHDRRSGDARAAQHTDDQHTHDDERIDALVDAIRSASTSVLHAVSWAWEHRWTALPTDWSALRDAGLARGLDHDERRYLAWVGAMRAHFAFAHAAMGRFCEQALLDYPGDELLTVLAHAAVTMQPEQTDAWEQLARAAHARHAEGIARHVYLTAANYAIDVPDRYLHDALAMARTLAGPDDVVAAYRVVSLLRRCGAYRDAILAGDAVNELLLTGAVDPKLADHLSERVLTERHLCIELLHQHK
jgi:hypothetical protein